MPLRRKSDDKYRYWQCKKCGHVVIAKERPDISWDDGHRCVFYEMHGKEKKNGK